jgi:hypothetical protein
MNAVTVETNIYSQNDAAKFAKACQSEVLQDIQVGTENYDTLAVTAYFTTKDGGQRDAIHVGKDEDSSIVVICNSQRLRTHKGGTFQFDGEDEATVHMNKALADAQAIYDAAVALQDRLIEDANAQLVASLTEHVAQFSSPEGRKLTPEEM